MLDAGRYLPCEKGGYKGREATYTVLSFSYIKSIILND